jgi:protein TonB
MLSIVAPSPRSSHVQVLRWGVCFGVVLFAHAIGAVALLQSLNEASEFDAGAPVVMLELPEAPTTLATLSNDLEPAPPVPEAEQTPPVEETRPLEPEAEVALPEPEPPKPEPPAEARPQTAQPSVEVPQPSPAPPTPGASVKTTPAVSRWESALIAHIARFKRYPSEARARGEQGITVVAFTIDRDGWIRNTRIVQSSGSQTLDQASLDMLQRAQPMPHPPAQVSNNDLSFRVPVDFGIRK